MVAWSEYFCIYHLPGLSAEQNYSQSEEINVIDESQAEKRPVQEAEIRWKKFPWSAVMFVVLSDCSSDNSRSPLTVLVRWVAYKGGLCFNLSSQVALLAGAPSLYVNRPLGTTWFEMDNLTYEDNKVYCLWINHYTVVCSVTWPLNGGEAGGDFALIQTLLFFHIDALGYL